MPKQQSRRSKERQNVKRLERRADLLEQRIATAKGSPQSISYDAAELSALRWAISQLAGRDWLDPIDTPPPPGQPVIVMADPGGLRAAVHVGGEWVCACGSGPIGGDVLAYSTPPPFSLAETTNGD